MDWDYVERARPLGEQFIASLPVDRSCVFLTYVWTPYNARATAEVLAVELGGTLVSPQLAGLETFDSSHLEPESAERFAQAFLDKAGPELARCLEVEQPPGPIASAGG
ncbi:MAG: hypothetical protein GWO02_15385 [Gammaproteobacteria bacterium]|nr:hypothetical protein [Gammaproteobacteria bacterium]